LLRLHPMKHFLVNIAVDCLLVALLMTSFDCFCATGRQGSFRHRRLQVTAGKRQQGWPVGTGRVSAGVLAKRDLSIDQRGLHRRELGRAKFFPSRRYAGPAPTPPRNMPFASIQPPSTCSEPLLINTGRGAHRAISS